MGLAVVGTHCFRDSNSLAMLISVSKLLLLGLGFTVAVNEAEVDEEEMPDK